jgi:hypothetical protein
MEKAVDARAVQRLGEPTPTSVLGIDETRFSRPRWVRNTQTGKWRLTDPWQTVFVDLHGDQGLLGQVTGRTSAAVVAWRDARPGVAGRGRGGRDRPLAHDAAHRMQTCSGPPRRRIAPTHWLPHWLTGAPRASLTSP